MRAVIDVTEPETSPGLPVPEQARALTPEELRSLRSPLPPWEDSVIEDLTEEEEAVFWEAITSA